MTRSIAITSAVIPAAGQGTRLRPLTYITPKEMLPLGRKPTAEHIVEELHSVGVRSIIFVVSPTKAGIREYFGDSACGGEVSVRYVVQEEQRGLADAILCAEAEVASEHFIVALGDSVMVSPRQAGPLARLVNAYLDNPAFATVSVERVPIQDACKYGMVSPVDTSAGDAFEIDGLVEKPPVEESPSEFAIGGRYIFNPGIFDWIRRTPPGNGGELQITDAIRLSIESGERVWCVPLEPDENRYDIGDFKVYSEAFTTISLLDPELAPSVRRAAERINR